MGEGAFIYSAGSAMVTTKNLEALGNTRFLSNLPVRFPECGTVIDETGSFERKTRIGICAVHKRE